MKIRTDFITNSSSSSFIIAFNKDHDLMKDLGVNNALELTGDWVNDCFYNAYSEFFQILGECKNMPVDEVLEYVENNALFVEDIDATIDKLRSEIEGCDFVSIIKVGNVHDNDLAGELEEEILPNMECCKYYICCH